MKHSHKHTPPPSEGGSYEQFLKHCPVCQTELRSGQVVVLARFTDRQFIHATCPLCCHALLFFQVASPGGTGLMGMVTDLSAADVRQLLGKGPISEDDVLRFHTYLRQPRLESLLTRANRE